MNRLKLSRDSVDTTVWNEHTIFLWDSLRIEILEALKKRNTDIIITCKEGDKSCMEMCLPQK